jgi:hypothetical protein
MYIVLISGILDACELMLLRQNVADSSEWTYYIIQTTPITSDNPCDGREF